MGAVLGVRARAREERRAAREAAAAAAEEAAPVAVEVQGPYRCATCGLVGNYTPSYIRNHEDVHRKELEKAREAQERRMAALQRDQAARGKESGKGARNWAARDKKYAK